MVLVVVELFAQSAAILLTQICSFGNKWQGNVKVVDYAASTCKVVLVVTASHGARPTNEAPKVDKHRELGFHFVS